MQRERRRNPYPWTWEIPVAVALAALFVIVISIQLGRSVANLLAGAGWTWPDANAGAFPSPIGTAFWTSLPGVFGGHADAGLPTPTPDGLAGRGLVWVSLAMTEVALLTATIWVGVSAYQRWGPGRMRGMATAGVFIGGGIAPKILPTLRDGRFMKAFLAKAPMDTLLEQFPVNVILNPDTGLIGAAVHAREIMGS